MKDIVKIIIGSISNDFNQVDIKDKFQVESVKLNSNKIPKACIAIDNLDFMFEDDSYDVIYTITPSYEEKINRLKSFIENNIINLDYEVLCQQVFSRGIVPTNAILKTLPGFENSQLLVTGEYKVYLHIKKENFLPLPKMKYINYPSAFSLKTEDDTLVIKDMIRMTIPQLIAVIEDLIHIEKNIKVQIPYDIFDLFEKLKKEFDYNTLETISKIKHPITPKFLHSALSKYMRVPVELKDDSIQIIPTKDYII